MEYPRKFDPFWDFKHEGKIYSKQVIHDNREAEVKWKDMRGKFIIQYRDDVLENWYSVEFSTLETCEMEKVYL